MTRRVRKTARDAFMGVRCRSHVKENDMKFRSVPLSFCLIIGFAGCDSLLGPVPDDVQTFVRAEGLPKVRKVREVFALDSVRMYRVSYGEPQDCPSGCFYLGGTLLKVGSRLGWIGLDTWELQFDSTRSLWRPNIRGGTNFRVVEADTVLASERLLGELLASDAYAHITLRNYLGLHEGTPEPVLWRVATRALAEVNSASMWLIVTHPNSQCSRRILEYLAEFRSTSPLYHEVRVRARESLETFSGRCSAASTVAVAGHAGWISGK